MLSIKNLSKSYKNSGKAIDNISFEIKKEIYLDLLVTMVLVKLRL